MCRESITKSLAATTGKTGGERLEQKQPGGTDARKRASCRHQRAHTLCKRRDVMIERAAFGFDVDSGHYCPAAYQHSRFNPSREAALQCGNDWYTAKAHDTVTSVRIFRDSAGRLTYRGGFVLCTALSSTVSRTHFIRHLISQVSNSGTKSRIASPASRVAWISFDLLASRSKEEPLMLLSPLFP
jgi:hypothetical protein